jgi:hypothetical protein
MSETLAPPNSANSASQVTLELPLDPPPPTDATEAEAASGKEPVARDPGDPGECFDHEPPVADPGDAHTSNTDEPSMPAEPPELPEPPPFGEIVDGQPDAEPDRPRCA